MICASYFSCLRLSIVLGNGRRNPTNQSHHFHHPGHSRGLPREVDVNAAPSAAGFRPLHRRLLRNRVPVLLLPQVLRSNLPHSSRPTRHRLGRRHQEVEYPFPYVREGETARGAKELPLVAGSYQTAHVA